MADKLHGRSLASDRQTVELAKSMTLDEIVKKTGRKPAAILRTALRLGVSIKGWKPKK